MSTTPIEPKPTQVKGIGKLLLNAWSAEHALRLTLNVPHGGRPETALNWTFPQAYYAAFFSARAVLASDGIFVANQKTVNLLMSQRADAGFYGPAQTLISNPFSALTVYQLGGEAKPQPVFGRQAVALNQKLADSVHALAIIHETYLVQRLGEDVYQEFIRSLPGYLQDSFVGARAVFITTIE